MYVVSIDVVPWVDRHVRFMLIYTYEIKYEMLEIHNLMQSPHNCSDNTHSNDTRVVVKRLCKPSMSMPFANPCECLRTIHITLASVQRDRGKKHNGFRHFEEDEQKMTSYNIERLKTKYSNNLARNNKASWIFDSASNCLLYELQLSMNDANIWNI